jgi:DNA polymerase-3 subunit delta'
MRNTHPLQWEQVQTALAQNRLAHALVLVGPLHLGLVDFARALTQAMICPHQSACSDCVDCQMIARNEHPDVLWVKPDKAAGAIKIDQIRALSSFVFLTPKRAKKKVIWIEAAERMNTAAANALLKMLEEPPLHTHFILIAEQIGTLVPTVLSRAQVLRFNEQEHLLDVQFEALSAHYSDSERGLVLQNAQTLLRDLLLLLNNTLHPCKLAAQWSAYELSALLWFLYLVFAKVQKMQFLGTQAQGLGASQLLDLSKLLDRLSVFKILETFTTVLSTLQQNRQVNAVLVLEGLFFDLTEARCSSTRIAI